MTIKIKFPIHNINFTYIKVSLILLCLLLSICLITELLNSDDANLKKDNISNIQTRNGYSLRIEVDYYPGFLHPNVTLAFDFLVSYFGDRGIETKVTFDSPNNEIEDGNGHINDFETWRNIERQYHDYEDTHIYFIIGEKISGGVGGMAHTFYGGGLSRMSTGVDYGKIRFIIMHEIGHCIGIGTHDDIDGIEHYSQSGFMRRFDFAIGTYDNITEYRNEDWNASFAPIDEYGNTSWCQARINNRFSIVGEIYDNTSDIKGNVIGDIDMPDWGISINISQINGNEFYSTAILPGQREFDYTVKPGIYIISPQEPYRFNETMRVIVPERTTVSLGNITIEHQQIPPLYIWSEILIILTVFSISSIILLFIIKRRHNIKQ